MTVIEALHNSEFMQALGESASQTTKQVIPEDQALRQQRKFRRQLRSDEEHAKQTLISAEELIGVCDQMIYAVEFL